MNNSNLLSFFKDGYIVIPISLFKYFKDLKISTDEFIFLMYLNGLGNNFLFNPSKFSDDLNMDLSKVMEYVDCLTNKGFLSLDVLKNEKGYTEEVVLLDGFYQKLSLLMMNDASNNSEINSSVFEMIESEFGRTLGPIEIEIIKAWLSNNMSEELIKEAVKEAVFNGVSNLRYIDKILYEWGKAGIKNVNDVEEMRKKRNSKNEQDDDIDMEIVDWNWFDDE